MHALRALRRGLPGLQYRQAPEAPGRDPGSPRAPGAKGEIRHRRTGRVQARPRRSLHRPGAHRGHPGEGHDLVLHHLQGLRGGLPGLHPPVPQAHRAQALPGHDGIQLPRGGPGALQGHGEQFQPLEHRRPHEGGLGQGAGRPPDVGEGRRGIPLLRRLRRVVRHPQPEGRPGPGQDLPGRGPGFRHPRDRGGLLRGLGQEDRQ